ncbi:hypothetical protein NBRC116591_01890 [Sessilibacter corallicola]|uniref:Uncharacterized protein n=1 Tax=Sessilibacter corallicola TaxID=2904075 RepID=A0ABQ0A409_9GAMM
MCIRCGGLSEVQEEFNDCVRFMAVKRCFRHAYAPKLIIIPKKKVKVDINNPFGTKVLVWPSETKTLELM